MDGRHEFGEARHKFFLPGNFAMDEAYGIMSRRHHGDSFSLRICRARASPAILHHTKQYGGQFIADALNHVTRRMDLNGD